MKTIDDKTKITLVFCLENDILKVIYYLYRYIIFDYCSVSSPQRVLTYIYFFLETECGKCRGVFEQQKFY